MIVTMYIIIIYILYMYIIYQIVSYKCCLLSHNTMQPVGQVPMLKRNQLLGSFLLHHGCHLSECRMFLKLTAVRNPHPSSCCVNQTVTLVLISKLCVDKYPTRCNCTQFILSINCSTCFGWFLHPSSGVQTTVSTASGTSQP